MSGFPTQPSRQTADSCVIPYWLTKFTAFLHLPFPIFHVESENFAACLLSCWTSRHCSTEASPAEEATKREAKGENEMQLEGSVLYTVVRMELRGSLFHALRLSASQSDSLLC